METPIKLCQLFHNALFSFPQKCGKTSRVDTKLINFPPASDLFHILLSWKEIQYVSRVFHSSNHYQIRITFHGRCFLISAGCSNRSLLHSWDPIYCRNVWVPLIFSLWTFKIHLLVINFVTFILSVVGHLIRTKAGRNILYPGKPDSFKLSTILIMGPEGRDETV